MESISVLEEIVENIIEDWMFNGPLQDNDSLFNSESSENEGSLCEDELESNKSVNNSRNIDDNDKKGDRRKRANIVENKMRENPFDQKEVRKNRKKRKLEIEKKKLELDKQKLLLKKTKYDLIQQYLNLKNQD